MAYSEAHKRATMNNDAKHYDKVVIRLPKGTMDRIKALGYSGNKFGVEAILAKLEEMEK